MAIDPQNAGGLNHDDKRYITESIEAKHIVFGLFSYHHLKAESVTLRPSKGVAASGAVIFGRLRPDRARVKSHIAPWNRTIIFRPWTF